MALLQTLQAIVLGIIQGLTEFLPISSSGHLLLVPWVLGWEPMGLTFDVIVHGGTLLAVVVYFREDWLKMMHRMFTRITRSEVPDSTHSLAMPLLIGTVPAVGAGIFFEDFIEDQLRSPEITAFALAAFGLLLWSADRRGSQKRSLESLSLLDGLLIGVAQAIALIPGVSRSGVTITAALFLGMSRADSAHFSFLLGTPIIAGATALRLYGLLQAQDMEMSSTVTLLAGVLSSSISGFLCIKYFFAFLRMRTYFAFVVYRLLLAACILFLLVH